MPDIQPLLTHAERLVLALLLVWLVALPLPFGANVAAAVPLTTTVPFALGLFAAVLRLGVSRHRATRTGMAVFPVVLVGGALFCGVIALQLLPIPQTVAGAVSPAAARLWASSSETLRLAGIAPPRFVTLSIDPAATLREFFRVLGLLATVAAAALLIRSHAKRLTLITVLGMSAAFQAAYAVREAALGRYAIWGWKNTKIFGRITGTFVNPNHFAHYMAIIIPLLVFVIAYCWRDAAPRAAPRRDRIAGMVERHFLAVVLSATTAVALVAAILLAQSRGALLALMIGSALVVAVTVRRHSGSRRRAVATALVVLATSAIAVAAIVSFLGVDRTVARFIPNAVETTTLVGRRIGIGAALEIWGTFPVAGSGAGTFATAVVTAQRDDLEKIYHHAHNDYAEIAATTGAVGFVIVLVTLVVMCRMLFVSSLRSTVPVLRWRRRAFQLAALASLSVAMVHALFDFNFFIPANALTLCAIVGAALSSFTRDIRTRL